jgi:hypothetical protein
LPLSVLTSVLIISCVDGYIIVIIEHVLKYRPFLWCAHFIPANLDAWFMHLEMFAIWEEKVLSLSFFPTMALLSHKQWKITAAISSLPPSTSYLYYS